MKKIVLGASLASLFVLGFATTPVLAGCADDIKALEKRMDDINSRNEGAKASVENMIEKAKKALAAGKTTKCNNIVAKANAKIDTAN